MLNTVAYFGHDAADAAVRRRVGAFQRDDFRVIGFMKRRVAHSEPGWENIDLGRTRDGAFVHRIISVFSGTYRSWKAKHTLKSADVIIARNLDMLATAVMARGLSGSSAPIIYECLDVHRMLCRDDFIGRTMRKIEAKLISKTAGLMVSSPAFLTEYFERYHGTDYRSRLVENRLVPGMLDAARGGTEAESPVDAEVAFRLGWVGVLRCSRSLDILCELAGKYPDTLRIEMHGIPALVEVPDFMAKIAPFGNIRFHGRYKSPEDLERIYNSIDAVWSIDFMEDGFNSTWLLPNRIYEGGYFCVPSIAFGGTETSKWLERKQSGFVIGEPLAASAAELVERLIAEPELVAEKRRKLAALDQDAFVQPEGFMRRTVLELVA